jgi:predicted metalloprotease with PDZ domain
VAGIDLRKWFRKTLASTEELDCSEALNWFGLRFAKSEEPAKAWKLEIRQDATESQKSHLQDL